MRILTILLLVVGLLVNGCTSDPATSVQDTNPSTDVATDTSPSDVATIDSISDGGLPDTSPLDASAPIDILSDGQTQDSLPADAEIDAGQPGDTPWGKISGDCGSVSAAVSSASASILMTTFTFDDPENFDAGSLEGRAKKRYEEPNAGGSSKCTEVMSMQLLMACEGATVNKLETEITYDAKGKIADYIIDIGGTKTGVSVTRAYKGPVVDVYTLEDATSLLEKKLAGIEEARQNVSQTDVWDTSMIHIWTLHPAWADTVVEAWNALDSEMKSSTVVLITVEEGSDYIVTDACDD